MSASSQTSAELRLEDKNNVPLLQALSLLARPDNTDLDFFENISHLQPHRRSRALRRLTTILDPASCSRPSQLETDGEDADMKTVCAAGNKLLSLLSTDFVMPLAYRVALDISENGVAKHGESRHAKSAEARDATRMDVSVWAAAACGAAALHLNFKDYRLTMGRVLRRLPREENESRLHTLYSILVAMADSFPNAGARGLAINGLDVTSTCSIGSAVVDQEMSVFLSRTALPQMLKHVNAGGIEGDILNAVIAGHTKRGRGGNGGTERTAMVFRAPVAVAAAKLMTKLTKDEMDSKLPLLVTPVANALRSRMNDVREGAKKALVEVILLLGADYMSYIIGQVLAVLAQGFRKDAGVYVLHSVLQGVKAARNGTETLKPRAYSIDGAAGTIANALAEEICEGVHSDSKDFDNPNVNNTRARDCARRASRAADAAEILGELLTFSDTADVVTKAFRVPLVQSLSSKLAVRLHAAVQRLIGGFIRNPSLCAADGLRYSHELVYDYMPPPPAAADDSATSCSSSSTFVSRRYSDLPRAHFMAEFGFQFLNNLLSKSIVKADGEDATALELRGMLEPFLLEAGFAMKSRFDALILVSLKVTQRLVRLPLASRVSVANDITNTVLADYLGKEVCSRELAPSQRKRRVGI
jgi:hypothetical protein